MARAAVVGHVEWVEFARVPRVPRQGEIAHADETFCEPAGGGAVAAVQLARLAGDCTFFTALGDDELAARVVARLEQLGVRVEHAVRRGEPTRRALTYLDDDGERTITTLGRRLHPCRDDALDWDLLAGVDASYFVAGDEGALRAARAGARALVATTRIGDLLARSRVQLDAAVGSAADPSEAYRAFEPPPRYVVTTDGARGGRWAVADGRSGTWTAAPLPGALADAYGAGDSFAAGLAYALGEQAPIERALEVAARCGATCMTGHGPYERQLTRRDPD